MPHPPRLPLALLITLVVGGCTTTTTTGGPRTPRSIARPGGASPSTNANDPLPADLLAIVDPCAQRLEDVAGALINYYRIHNAFPKTLQEAQETSIGGTKLAFTCPVSKQPYVYAPAGLQSLGHHKRILVADPTPAHDQKRWCIFYDIQPGKSLPYVEVLPVTEGSFETYLPAAELITPP